MTYIINYIIALTFGILGWQIQTPQLEGNLEVISNLSECIPSTKEIEKVEIDPDTFLLFKDFRIDIKTILTTKRQN